MAPATLASPEQQTFQPIVGPDGCTQFVEVLSSNPAALTGLTPEQLCEHDLRMLAVAAQRAAGWQMLHPGVGISFNASPSCLAITGYAVRIIHILAASGLAVELARLEITEEVELDLTDPTIEANLIELSMAGVGIALDDYGTGYATAEVLKKLQEHPLINLVCVKLAREFVNQIPAPSKPLTEGSEAFLKEFTELYYWAVRHGLTLVAEGIEPGSEWLRDLMHELSIWVQGWVYAGGKLDLDSFLAWLESRPVRLAAWTPGSGWDQV